MFKFKLMTYPRLAHVALKLAIMWWVSVKRDKSPRELWWRSRVMPMCGLGATQQKGSSGLKLTPDNVAITDSKWSQVTLRKE